MPSMHMRFLILAVFLGEALTARSARRNRWDNGITALLDRIKARHGGHFVSEEDPHDLSRGASLVEFEDDDSLASAAHARKPPHAPKNQLPVYILLMTGGILIGCLLLCCFSKVANSLQKLDKDQETRSKGKEAEPVEETASLTSAVKKVVRFTRATITSIGKQIVLDDSEPEQQEESPDQVATNRHRLVTMETLYVLNEELANHFVESTTVSPVFPVQDADGVAQLSAWHSCSWALLEDEDGLHLGVRFGGKEMKHQLMGWKNNPATQLEVKMLPMISVDKGRKSRPTGFNADGKPQEEEESEESEEEKWVLKGSYKIRKQIPGDDSVHVQFRERALSVMAIPVMGKQEPTSLSPFLIKWNENLVTVLGSEDEDISNKWVKILNMYSNIGQRFYSAFMWKLNSDVASDLKGDFEEDKEALADIRNWRRRLCLLEYLHHQKSLCITYMSEKEDDGRVGNIIVSADGGEVATVKTVPPLQVLPLASWEEEQVRVNVHQYNIALAGDGSSGSVSETAVPKILYGFEVRQETSEHGGSEHSMYAFDDEGGRAKWLEVMDTAMQTRKRSI